MKHLNKFKHMSFSKWFETIVTAPFMSVFLCFWVLIFNLGVMRVISSSLFNWKKLLDLERIPGEDPEDWIIFIDRTGSKNTVADTFSCWNAWVLPWHQRAVQSTDPFGLWSLHWVCQQWCQLWSRHLSIRNYTETTNSFHTDHWKDIRWQ